MATATGLFLVFVAALFVAIAFIVGFLFVAVRRLENDFHRLSTPDLSRYAAPTPETVRTSDSAALDVTGAWALEQEMRGLRITDEELAVQRRMWAEEGLL